MAFREMFQWHDRAGLVKRRAAGAAAVAAAVVAVVVVAVMAMGLVTTAAQARGGRAVKPWRAGVTATQRWAAQKLLRKGNALMIRLDHAKALTVYREAIGHWDHPAIQFNIAQCLIQLDRPLEAYAALSKALRYGQAPHSPSHYRQALGYKKLLLGRLAWLTVRCSVPGARVTVNGKDWFVGPGEEKRLVLPGRHQILAAKKKFVTSTRRVVVMPGKVEVVKLVLVPMTVVGAGGVRTETKRRWKRWMPWTVLGVGAAVALAGLPLALKSRSESDAFDSYIKATCTQPAEGGDLPGCLVSTIPASVYDHQSAGETYSKASIAVFAVGGAAVVAGIVLVILNRGRLVEVEGEDPSNPPKSGAGTVMVLPVVSPHEVGVSAAFRF